MVRPWTCKDDDHSDAFKKLTKQKKKKKEREIPPDHALPCVSGCRTKARNIYPSIYPYLNAMPLIPPPPPSIIHLRFSFSYIIHSSWDWSPKTYFFLDFFFLFLLGGQMLYAVCLKTGRNKFDPQRKKKKMLQQFKN